MPVALRDQGGAQLILPGYNSAAMAKIFVPREEMEYARLLGDYCLAVNDSYQKLVSYGIDSKEFQEANAQAIELCAKMRRIEAPTKPLEIVGTRLNGDLAAIGN